VAALAGAAIGPAVALATGASMEALENGLYGFNSSLSVTAMFMFYAPSKGTALMGVLAGIMTYFGQEALSTLLQPFGLPFLTLPFCVATLPFIILQGTSTLVIAVPLASMTIPEEHVRTVSLLRDGFSFLKEALAQNPMALDKRGKYSGRHMTKSMHALSSALNIDPLPKLKPLRSFFRSTHDEGNRVRVVASAIFHSLDQDKIGLLTSEQFSRALEDVGLEETGGLTFACCVFDLLDLDKSGTIDKYEFIALVLVSSCLRDIRRKIKNFFSFVDADGNDSIDVEELNTALVYLGEPGLSDEECDRLLALNRVDEFGDFDLIELVNFVIVAKIKSLLASYHEERLDFTHIM
jgi:Ca2+-binding EF-hand superfamily protein